MANKIHYSTQLSSAIRIHRVHNIAQNIVDKILSRPLVMIITAQITTGRDGINITVKPKFERTVSVRLLTR